jgi:plastocyanin
MRLRVAGVFVAGMMIAAVVATAVAQSDGTRPPVPELGFLKPVPAGACVATNTYEQALWKTYGDKCKRLHFAFGPILAKPGQNDVLIQPVTIEKPAYPGYIVRFRPDLVDVTGKPPLINELHLHHATWLNGYPQYGNGPFFAAGEEKTIATFPPGYGMHVNPADTWLLLYMVHNLTPNPRPVWITYDVDFIADQDAASLGIVPVKPVWLDVQHKPIAPGAVNTPGNPVFNVQRGFGHLDAETGKLVCTWPKENCSHHDVYGGTTPQQGVPLSNIGGADWTVDNGFGGTLIGIGGHMHPGGIRDEVSLVRNGVEKPIFISDSVAWARDGSGKAGGPKDSWDFSMGVTGSTIGWKVKVKPGDVIRLNAVYDSQDASWYENMGIVVAFVAPAVTEKEDALHGGKGVDVFDQPVALDPGFPTTATPTAGWLAPTCTPNLDPGAGALRLCLRGQVTHSHLAEASVFGGCTVSSCNALPAKQGPIVNTIASLGFTYGIADAGVIGQTGIPRLKVGKTVTLLNFDTVADIWHTFTRCAEPCSGATGLDYPIANGSSGTGDKMDFDSTEIGWGLFFSPASGQIGGSNESLGQSLQDGLFWKFTPETPGVYSLFCRIHPFMRGAFEVVN